MDLMVATLVQAAREIMPRETGFGQANLNEIAPLYAVEDLGPATPARMQEFAAGRLALRRAMQAIGVAAQPVPRAPDRAPFWPDGLIGAITHSGQQALAIIAKSQHHGGLGIDLVSPSDWPEPDLWPLFFNPAECARATVSDAAAALAAKEATIKLLRDATGRTHSFLELSVTLGPEADAFSVRVNPRPHGADGPTLVCGKLRFVAGHVLALCATAPLCHTRHVRSAAIC